MTGTTDSRARLDLSGPWQLAFDPGGEGIRGGWTRENWPEARSVWVQVPALWNVSHPDAEGVGFYRRSFTVPTTWHGRMLTPSPSQEPVLSRAKEEGRGEGEVVRLHFGGACYRAEAWLNGAYVGSHEGAYTPFWFDVTPLIRAGAENLLVVRVAALSKTQDVDGMVLLESPASKQSWYYTHGGLWGEVFLESVPPLFCQSVTVEPDPHQEMVLVEVAASNRHAESQRAVVHLQVAGPDGSLAAEERSCVAVPPGTCHLTYRIPLPRPLLWSPEAPNLYQLGVGIGNAGEEADSQAVVFGMREFTARDGEFFLNGEPIYLRGLLLQPHYPVTLVTPPTREMMVRELTLAKEAGFNLLRAHLRPAPPGYLDLADQMGLLVYAESSLAWIKDSPRLLDHARRELQAMIERDRNHPSVVFWGIHNENRAASALTSTALIRFVRALDPTRVIVDNSGGAMAIDQDFGWVDRTTVVSSREMHRQRIQDVHIYVGAPLTPPVYEWMRTLGVSDPPVDISAHDFGSPAMAEEFNRECRSYRGKVFVSELGCGGMADLDEVVAGYGTLGDRPPFPKGSELSGRCEQGILQDAREMKAFRDSLHQGFEARRLDRIFGSLRGLIVASQAQQAAGLTRQIEALLVNPRVSGFIVTQLNDVAWEFHAGILDPWRNPKPVYHALKRLNGPHCVVLKAATPVVACGECVEVAATLLNRRPLHGDEQIHVTVCTPAGKQVERSPQLVSGGVGIRQLPAISIRTGEMPGEYRVSACLIRGQETLAESTEVVLALPRVALERLTAGVEFVGAPPGAFNVQGQGADQKRQQSDVAEPLLLAADPPSLTGEDWTRLLDGVEMGRVAIVGPLHKRDGLALRALKNQGLDVRLDYGIGNWMGCYHWIPASDLFAGLPSNCLGSEAYADVLPWYCMSELGGDVLAGSLRNTQTRREPSAILWYSDIEAVCLGQGTLILCQYRAFGQARTNPLAARLVHNMIRLAQDYQHPDVS